MRNKNIPPPPPPTTISKGGLPPVSPVGILGGLVLLFLFVSLLLYIVDHL